MPCDVSMIKEQLHLLEDALLLREGLMQQYREQMRVLTAHVPGEGLASRTHKRYAAFRLENRITRCDNVMRCLSGAIVAHRTTLSGQHLRFDMR